MADGLNAEALWGYVTFALSHLCDIQPKFLYKGYTMFKA